MKYRLEMYFDLECEKGEEVEEVVDKISTLVLDRMDHRLVAVLPDYEVEEI